MDPTSCYYVFEYLDWQELKILKNVSRMFNRVAYRVQAARDMRPESNSAGLFNRCYLCDELAIDRTSFTKCAEDHCTFMYHNEGICQIKKVRNDVAFDIWFDGLGGVPVLPFEVREIGEFQTIKTINKKFKIRCLNCKRNKANWRCNMCEQNHIYEICPYDGEENEYCQLCIDIISECMMCGLCRCKLMNPIDEKLLMCDSCCAKTDNDYECE